MFKQLACVACLYTILLVASGGETSADKLVDNLADKLIDRSLGGDHAAIVSPKKVAMQNDGRESKLIKLVNFVNNVYIRLLDRPTPFMRYVFIGLQSTGKSTIVERMLGFPMNIVADGTGTRCPLHVTCIYDEEAQTPECDLDGEELPLKGVFERITKHHKKLATDKNTTDGFCRKPLSLTVRSNRVKNMMFVDLPGIITTRSTERDSRSSIKRILQQQMSQPNTEFLVLLEPKEFETNSIINDIDEALGDSKWRRKATFFMTKFDMVMNDKWTGSRVNAFFKEFRKNGIFPYMVSSPSVQTSRGDDAHQFEERQKLLANAGQQEQKRFDAWFRALEDYRKKHPKDEKLDDGIEEHAGFSNGLEALHKKQLDTFEHSLGNVEKDLHDELTKCKFEKDRLEQKKLSSDQYTLRVAVSDVLNDLQDRVLEYHAGTMKQTKAFRSAHQTLEQELVEERNSDWASKKLNNYLAQDAEDEWRESATNLQALENAEVIGAGKKMFGGSQYNRAVSFMLQMMAAKEIDWDDVKQYISTVAGFERTGAIRENWEQIVHRVITYSLRNITHPGVNFLTKHAGNSFRRYFKVALEDASNDNTDSCFVAKLQALPAHVKTWLTTTYEEVVWTLMQKASVRLHESLEPMYSSLHPYLRASEEDDLSILRRSGSYAFSFMTWLAGRKANKEDITEIRNRQLTGGKQFLPGGRLKEMTSKSEDVDVLIDQMRAYIPPMMENILRNLHLSFDHYLYNGFQASLKRDFGTTLLAATDWSLLVQKDEDLHNQLIRVDSQIEGLQDSLRQVRAFQR